jgi:dTDP-4-dehydrorhamnose 3,5-epimerase
MRLIPTELEGAFIIEFEPVRDERGHFMRFYDRDFFAENDLQTTWQQESLSFNKHAGTVRGLHFQKRPFAETKVVRVVNGAIRDVIVDLRTGSKSYAQWIAVELTATNGRALYVPKGFAHGFCTLEANTAIEYKIDVAYRAEVTGGVRWNDPELAIGWSVDDPVISDRDAGLPFLAELDLSF